MCIVRQLVFLFAPILVLSGMTAAGENWPQFRGPRGLGIADEKGLPLHWGGESSTNVLWKAPLVGQGHASPIVWGNRVFVCTVHWPPSVEDRAKVIPEHHVLCYAVDDGRMLWDTKVRPGPWLRTDFRSGPGGGYAAPTPATDGRRVFCAYGSSVLAALDFDGKVEWRKEIVPSTFDVTLGSSPVLYEDTVILFCAMAKVSDSRVVAFDKKSGEVRWERKLPTTGFGHSTPVILDVQGKPQMLVLASAMSEGPRALQSLDPRNGKILWWCRGAGDAASPAYGSGRVYFDSGRGGTGVCVDAGGTGDVSATHVKWTVNVQEAIGSPIIVGDLVYRLQSPGVLLCWDLKSGQRVYKERLERIFTTWASPVADAEGRLYFASAGKSFVIRGGRKFEVLATNDLGDGNHPSPAVARGRMFLVGMQFVYCIGEKR